jgi:hypothetical protein
MVRINECCRVLESERDDLVSKGGEMETGLFSICLISLELASLQSRVTEMQESQEASTLTVG